MDTGVNVALPAITADFGTDMQTIQWIIVSHVAARAGLSVGAGSSADLLGLKRVFLVGAACNTVALLAVGLTPDLYVIFGFRVLQGIGTGILLAASPAVAAQAFPPQKRGGVMGIAFSSQALGLIAATLGAAVLLELAGQELQGDSSTQRSVLSQEDFAHSTAANLLEDEVTRHGGPDHIREWLGLLSDFRLHGQVQPE